MTDQQQKSILLKNPTPLYATKPGLQEIKQVELFSKYRPLGPIEYRDECCPRPCKKVIEKEKDKKKAKGKLKRDEKKEKGKLTVTPGTAVRTRMSGNGNEKKSLPTTPLSPSKRLHEEAELEYNAIF